MKLFRKVNVLCLVIAAANLIQADTLCEAKNFPSDIHVIPTDDAPKGLRRPEVKLQGVPGGIGSHGKTIGPIDIESPAHLITGSSTSERWAKFCAIQPTVFGMKVAQVQKMLGPGLRQDSRLGYTIEERRGAGKSYSCSIQVTFHIFEGAIESYELGTIWSK